MMGGDTVFVDTNVLLSATAPLRTFHRAALTVLNDWPNQEIVLAISSQVLREYLVVATRPLEVNGLGLAVEDALANASAFRRRMRLLPENEQTWELLHDLVSRYRVQGKRFTMHSSLRLQDLRT